MAQVNDEGSSQKSMDPQRRMNQVINKAFDVVEKQIEEGTVSPSILTFLMKMGTDKDGLETENLRTKSELNKSRIKEIDEKASQKTMMEKAIQAFKSYQPDD